MMSQALSSQPSASALLHQPAFSATDAVSASSAAAATRVASPRKSSRPASPATVPAVGSTHPHDARRAARRDTVQVRRIAGNAVAGLRRSIGQAPGRHLWKFLPPGVRSRWNPSARSCHWRAAQRASPCRQRATARLNPGQGKVVHRRLPGLRLVSCRQITGCRPVAQWAHSGPGLSRQAWTLVSLPLLFFGFS